MGSQFARGVTRRVYVFGSKYADSDIRLLEYPLRKSVDSTDILKPVNSHISIQNFVVLRMGITMQLGSFHFIKISSRIGARPSTTPTPPPPP
jgi:hypothetical protein